MAQNISKNLNHNFTQNLSNSPNKPIKTEQIEQIIKAIISGKYSWACVLMLQFSGYDPVDYIPYRTYIRLLKNNYLLGNSQNSPSDIPNVQKLQNINNKSTCLT